MQELPNSLQGILDIKPPLPPLMEAQGYASLTLGVIIGVVMVLVTYAVWRYLSNSRYKARQRLKGIIRSLARQATGSAELAGRHAAFTISTSLCHGLHLNGISTQTKLPKEMGAYEAEWEAFTQNLSAARFAPAGMKAKEVIPLAREAMLWLKRWP